MLQHQNGFRIFGSSIFRTDAEMAAMSRGRPTLGNGSPPSSASAWVETSLKMTVDNMHVCGNAKARL